MLVYAYRIVQGDRVSGTPAPVEAVENRNGDEVVIKYQNGHSQPYRANAFLNVSHRPGVRRPRYRPEHGGGGDS